ncbi:OLC1v1006783C1 [Oldenlandia corymbosa var. corymbosa]|uniref:OLC1v1006783C1 n=1 Tax=Oldenlandia corymbosa var. corymbosa TaxID=529605 RepID=A0AAV1DIG1_OLDCO|nr:OLC1v1006783C1 [Oldenlandia corymbosa var. corymbosa]
MELTKNCWLWFLVLSVTVQFASCDQEGFLSLSCGGTTTYVDSSNISWIPDASYINVGNMTTVDYLDRSSSSRLPVRFFPDSLRSKCYRLPLSNVSSVVLVRAQFVYKNYDGLDKPPEFSVSLGRAMTTTVNLANTDPWIEEFIWPVDKGTLSLCFHSLPGGGVPVVSSLELRPLPQGAYSNGLADFPSKLLKKTYRINCGYVDGSLRYPIDQYDRIWDADKDFSPYHVSSGFDIQNTFNLTSLKENPPVAVLQTARVLARWSDLTYNLPIDDLGDYYIVLYFAGILPVSPAFDILINGEVVRYNYSVQRWNAEDLSFTMRGIKSLNITLKSTSFYPLINALEVYEIQDIPRETSSTTVSALQVIQQSTGMDLGWQDDPCSPKSWQHIECNGNMVSSLDLSNVKMRSISPTFGDLLDLKILDLSNTSLSGEIQYLGSLQSLEKLNLSFNQLTSFGSEFEDLMNLQVLDLQNNSLVGLVPESLGELKNLHLLNLENNKLQGPLPQSLNRKSLNVRTSGNLCLSFSTLSCTDVSGIQTPQVTIFSPSKPKDHKHIAAIIGAVGGVAVASALISVCVILFIRRKKPQESSAQSAQVDIKNWNSAKVFSYKEIRSATHNFKEVIGRGSFGSVYLGKLPDGKLVAVKVRFDKTQLGAESFVNEVSLLSRIRHQCLVSLEGFCQEAKQQILVYEYLPGGSLSDNLYGTKSKRITLSWVRRLKIAVDAAKGLDYLHNGNDPRIIHRDVKSSNILMDSEMNAKMCDFGLSKQMTQGDATHITTAVKGTAGYLDPEYYSTRQLTEKSDVYSFGVVLLELICGREPLTHSGSPDSYNLVLWAKPYLQAGAFEIVDESIKGTYDPESMRRSALIASRSVERDASRRPCIAEVLAELKQAYSIQLAYLASGGFMN